MTVFRCAACSCGLLDRLMEVMRHFHCEDPEELESLLRLPKDSLTTLFRNQAENLPETVLRVLGSAGVRKEFITAGTGSLLADSMDGDRLEVLKRHAAHLLKVICKYSKTYERSQGPRLFPPHVTDGRPDPIAIEEELINLLIEALSEKETRDCLLEFIRMEAANRSQMKNR
ncbi:MAG: hypothetical protein V1794_11685 [Candidatus Glassbacteria bacterium]